MVIICIFILNNEMLYYYRIYKFHKELFKNDVPVNIRQILRLIGSEVLSLDLYVPKINRDYLIPIKLNSCLGYEKKATKPYTKKMKQLYQWDALIKSIQEKGVIVPIVIERYIYKKRERYLVLEGRHRLAAAMFIEPFNPELLISSIIVDRDWAYTEYMRNKN